MHVFTASPNSLLGMHPVKATEETLPSWLLDAQHRLLSSWPKNCMQNVSDFFFFLSYEIL